MPAAPSRSAFNNARRGLLSHTRRRAHARCSNNAALSVKTTEIGSTAWVEFATKASGEYEGQAVRFDPNSGAALPLDDTIVPDAYREWGVELVDRQANSHSIASDDGIRLLTRLVYPAVGCEADAVSFDSTDRTVLRGHNEAKTILPNGAFSAGCRILPEDAFTKMLMECAIPVSYSTDEEEPEEPVRYRFRHQLNGRGVLYVEVIAEQRVAADYKSANLAEPLPPSTCCAPYPEWAPKEPPSDGVDANALNTASACLTGYWHLGDGENELGEPILMLAGAHDVPTCPMSSEHLVALGGPHNAFHGVHYEDDDTLHVVAGLESHGWVSRKYTKGRLEHICMCAY